MNKKEIERQLNDKRQGTLEDFKKAYDESQPQPKLTRAERRRIERNRKKYDKMQTFTRQEVEAMNEHAYKYGVAFALIAAKETLSLGEVRLDRIRKRVTELEMEYFQNLKPFDDLDEITEYKGAVKHGGK